MWRNAQRWKVSRALIDVCGWADQDFAYLLSYYYSPSSSSNLDHHPVAIDTCQSTNSLTHLPGRRIPNRRTEKLTTTLRAGFAWSLNPSANEPCVAMKGVVSTDRAGLQLCK